MNPKFTSHEPKKLPVYPVTFVQPKNNPAPKKQSDFAPLLSKSEIEHVKHMTNHQRVVFMRNMRKAQSE